MTNIIMHLAILGSGAVAKQLAIVFSAKGHTITIISRNIATAAIKLHEILSKTITMGDSRAIRSADAVFLAIGGHPSTLGDVESILHDYGITNNLIADKIVIDATNPFRATADSSQCSAFFKLSSLGETYQCLLPGSRFYKAFNTIGVRHLGDGTFQGTKASMMYAGNASDKEAVSVVESLIRDTDFEPQWVGPMRFARNLESIAELWANMAAINETGDHVAISVLRK